MNRKETHMARCGSVPGAKRDEHAAHKLQGGHEQLMISLHSGREEAVAIWWQRCQLVVKLYSVRYIPRNAWSASGRASR